MSKNLTFYILHWLFRRNTIYYYGFVLWHIVGDGHSFNALSRTT